MKLIQAVIGKILRLVKISFRTPPMSPRLDSIFRIADCCSFVSDGFFAQIFSLSCHLFEILNFMHKSCMEHERLMQLHAEKTALPCRSIMVKIYIDERMKNIVYRHRRPVAW